MISILGYFFYQFEKVKRRAISQYLGSLYNSKIVKVGKGVKFNGISIIAGLEKVEIGDNVHIGDNAYIRAEGGLYIGDNTHISRNLVLYTHNHNYEGEVLPYDNTFKYRKVIIEKNVWIGMNVIILPGAHIMEGAIIGAGAVVAGRVEKCAIVVAQKAELLTYRKLSHYEELEENHKYGGISGKPIS